MTETKSAATNATSAYATKERERHGFVDALRGFSLLGILLVNIEFIVQASETGWNSYTSATDRVVRWLVIALGQGKIYPLFGLLFGYGLALQLRKADQAAASTGRGNSDIELSHRYRRRMVGLFVLGVLHGVFFFPGDILVIYAVIGAVAYRLRRRTTPELLRLAAQVHAVAALVWLALGLLEALDGPTGSAGGASAEAIEVLSSGSFGDVAVLHFFYWIVTLGILSAIQGPAVFAFFLAGVALGRTPMLANPQAHGDVALRVLRWAPLGLVGAAIGATLTLMGDHWETLGFAIGFGTAPLLAAGYLAALALLIGSGGRVSKALQASGRMSLSIYLLESIVASTLAYGYGAGLFGKTGPLAGVAWAAAIWVTLSLFALLWMRWARFGPMEWALRSFTYDQQQPLWRYRR